MKTYVKSFAAGEISPSLYGRVDLSKYATGLRTLRNCFVARTGGAYNRAGLGFRTSIKDQTHRARLFRFQSTTGKHFQIEVGHLYLRILTAGQPQMVAPKTIVSSVLGTTTQYSTSTAHGFKVGDLVTITGATVTNYNGDQTVTAVTRSTFTTNRNSTSYPSGIAPFGTVSMVTARAVDFVAPWTDVQLREITFVQDGNTLVLVHQSTAPRDLTYYFDDSWDLTTSSTEPRVQPPIGLLLDQATGTVFYYAVTAIDPISFEESYVSATIGSSTAASVSTPIKFSWTPNGAQQYNVYGGISPQTLGFRSVVFTNGFTDNGSLFADYSNPPPAQRSPFVTASPTAYPAAVGTYQQRRYYGNIGPDSEIIPQSAPLPGYRAPDRIIGSRIGSAYYFALRRPPGDDDALFFRMLHRRPQIIRHLLDIGKLVVFTEQGEWVMAGTGDNGSLTPSQLNPTNVSQNGSGMVAPLQIQNLALYVQNKGSIIRTFGFQFQIEGYRGDDLTTFSGHLFAQHQVVAWDYQKLPHPIVWAARDDGTFLSLTFVPEQDIYAWARHDTANGFVEDVVESDDRIYMIVRRTINGQTARYVERMHRRDFATIKDAIFMDCSFSYNGEHDGTDGSSIVLSGGTTWANGDVITLTLSGGTAAFSPLTHAVHVTGVDGTFIRFTSITYVSPTVVTGTPEKTVPVIMRGSPSIRWADARNSIQGLAFLEGQAVSIIGDGFVVANPNNDDYVVRTVTGGQVSFGNTAYGRIHIGLPYVSDLETLNIDTAQGESILDRKKLITKVSAWVEGTRGVWAGGAPPDDDLDDPRQGLMTGFDELKARYDEKFDAPINVATRVIEINIQGQWNSHGRVFVRQIDPLPLGILSIAPTGLIPFQGG